MTSTLPISTASNPLGVLDEQLRIRGVQGLRVADASVFPTGLSCHTQAAVVAVVRLAFSFSLRRAPADACDSRQAERCADLLAIDWAKASAA